MAAVSYLVEGLSDQPVADRLIEAGGGCVGTPVVAGGKPKLDPKVRGLNKAARRHNPWLILRDLDRDDDHGCCGPLVDRLTVDQPLSPFLVLRFPVRSMDGWLLADAVSFASFFQIARSRVPKAPDELDNPKLSLINLCRGSRSRAIRDGVPPRSGSGRSVGPRYVEMVSEFARTTWRPTEARQSSPSLARALDRLTERILVWDSVNS